MSHRGSYIVVAALPPPPVRRQAMASLLLRKVSGSVPCRTTRTPPRRPTTAPCELHRCSPMCATALFASPPLLVRRELPPHPRFFLPFLQSHSTQACSSESFYSKRINNLHVEETHSLKMQQARLQSEGNVFEEMSDGDIQPDVCDVHGLVEPVYLCTAASCTTVL
ncbi:uncharacterized protein LOC119281139 [Triticum dicoccoides]|uniref:uncharacterized protein LOC119281139 n=1 Tax=Triticum dicoccoides TaxID=85692 RepID=UPI00188F1387|nr:uncharacterized protein LOC119281139 [Triticum dicoccoides]